MIGLVVLSLTAAFVLGWLVGEAATDFGRRRRQRRQPPPGPFTRYLARRVADDLDAGWFPGAWLTLDEVDEADES